MASRDNVLIEITPEVLLKAYACGIFPMAESAEDPALYWIEPERRGVMLFEEFHIPARLARTVRNDPFRVVCDQDFDGVIDGCAEPRPGRAALALAKPAGGPRLEAYRRSGGGLGAARTGPAATPCGLTGAAALPGWAPGAAGAGCAPAGLGAAATTPGAVCLQST